MTYPQLTGDSYQDFEPYIRANNAIEEDINDAWREQEQAEHEQWANQHEGLFRDEIQGEK